MPQAIDVLIYARWVITVNPDCETREHCCVAINDHQIVDILDQSQANARYQPEREFRLDRHALIPGFVNTHTHAAMTLFRGLADDIPLMEWLNNHVWPAETRWVNEEFVRVGTTLAIAEMFRNGTTCFNDMYFFPDVVADAAQRLGMRAVVGLILIDFATAWAADPEVYLRKGLTLHDTVRSWDLVTTAFAPHAPYTVSDTPLAKIQTLADELDIPVHMHVHETQHEIRESMTKHHVRPLERLSQLGLLTNRLLAVHMTHLLPAEIEACANSGTHVVHCPESNLKLASGLCRVTELLDTGVNVALGTDGAASNNDLDMLSEMRTAALLAKGVSGEPTALPAYQALRMATINGARALGLEDRIGSIELGKAADLVAIDLEQVTTQPVYDPVTQVVYSAGREQVSHVWVNGQQVLAEGQLLTINTQDLLVEVQHWASKIVKADRRQTAGASS